MSIPAAYIGVIIIWSTTPLAIQWSGEEVGFLFGVTGRMVLGLLASLLVIAMLRKEIPRHRQALHTYLAAGAGIFLAMLSVYWSSRFIPSGWIAVIFGTAPIITGAMAMLWLGEQGLTPSRLAGIGLGLAGLVFIFSGGQSLGPDAGYGVAGVLASVIIHSASAIAVKRIGAGLPSLAVTAGGLLVAVPLYLLVYLLFGEPFPVQIPQRAILSIIYLGLVGSVVGFALYFYVLRHVEATRVALITLATPVLALILGNRLNDETLLPQIWGGTAIILAGLRVYEFGDRLRRKLVSGSRGQ